MYDVFHRSFYHPTFYLKIFILDDSHIKLISQMHLCVHILSRIIYHEENIAFRKAAFDFVDR